MKKIFTLIATAILAVAANAQGSYYLTADNTGTDVTAGTQVTAVDNIVMTYGGAFKDGKAAKNNFKDIDTNFAYKVTASADPGDFDATNTDVPTSGGFITFKASVAGTVGVAYKLNKNKSQYFVDEDNKSVIEAIAGATDKSTYLYTEFPVVADKTYYVYTKASKIEFYGFKFTTEGTDGINTAKAETAIENGVMYNANGQQVGKNYKGLVVKNGKKFVQK